MREFVTSDLHLFHKNILKHCPDTRRGSDYLEMGELLIEEWNKTITKRDKVYIIGDFSFGSSEQTYDVVKRMNGHKCLIVGNHCEESKWLHVPEIRNEFELIRDRYKLKYKSMTFILDHYPIQEWRGKHKGWAQLHGHSHGYTDSRDMRRFDVGIDARPDTHMRPWDMDQILDIMSRRPMGRREHEINKVKPEVQW